MIGTRLRSSRPSSNGEEPAKCVVNLSAQQFKHGDVVWSRINGESWWPVQVADEKCVACKPKKLKNDQILVRLYGTFEHIYVEPVNCVSKIEKILGQENSSNREIFQKFLEEDLTHMKSGGQSAATVSESKEISEIEKEKDEAPIGNQKIKGKLKRTMIAENFPLADSSDNPKKAAKKIKVVTSEDMNAVKASEIGVTKRRTRSEAIKDRNGGTSRIEVSTISSFDKRDLRSSRCKNGEAKSTSNVLDEAPESTCLKTPPDVSNIAQIECSDAKDIKKLVAKIVMEVAEKARNEALEGRGMEICPKNTECIDSSRKKSSVIKKVKRLIPRRVKNKDIAARIAEGAVDDIRHDDCDDNERTKDAGGTEMPASNVVQKDGKPGETEDAMNGLKREASGEKMESFSTTKCFPSPRCRRVMQSLGLIAPLGSPFSRNGLIRSLLP